MSLLRKTNGLEFYAVPNQQWVVCAEYPHYEELLPFFDFTGVDVSESTATVNGIQRPIANEEWTEQRKKYIAWMLEVFHTLQIPITKPPLFANSITDFIIGENLAIAPALK